MLLVLSLGSQALTLGRARGAAIIAQPLNLSVGVSYSADEDVSDLCFEAEVFYGENKVDPGRVSVSSETPVAGQARQLRILSRLPIDEPVVTVYVRSTCASKTSRKYVLLADVTSEVAQSAPALPQFSVAPEVQANKQVDASVSKAEPTANTGVPVTPAPASSTKSRKVAVDSRKPSASGAALPPSAGTAKARLKLAPLDLSVERDPTLKPSQELSSLPTEDLQRRGEAAALWRALNLSPEDVLRDAARLQGLESNVQKWAEASSLNQRQIKDLQLRLERAESERYWNPVVMGLGALILAMAAGGIWLVRRQRSQSDGSPWWSAESREHMAPDSVLSPQVGLASAAAELGELPSIPASRNEVVPATPLPAQGAVDIDLDLDLDEAPIPVKPTPLNVNAAPVQVAVRSSRLMGLKDFSQSLSGSLRAINTQEMLDIRQQAEFFMTLGQYDDAIALLEGHIADSVDSNPSVYLDLLKIFHTLSRKDEFDRYREAFNTLFTGQVPEYIGFMATGDGLEVYPELCSHLVKLWPSREALEFLESCMVRQPESAAHMLFDLEAFKELLLLHAVCGRLVNALDGVPAAFSASKAAFRESPQFHTGPSPMDVTLPLTDMSAAEVDLELDMPLESIPEAPVTAENLIDFEVSGFTSSKRDQTP